MLVLPSRRFRATSLDDAVPFFAAPILLGQLVSRLVTSNPRVGLDVLNADVATTLVLEQSVCYPQPDGQ